MGSGGRGQGETEMPNALFPDGRGRDSRCYTGRGRGVRRLHKGVSHFSEYEYKSIVMCKMCVCAVFLFFLIISCSDS